MRIHVSIDLVKIGLEPKLQKGLYLGGWVVFYLLGGQNRNFMIFRGSKLLLSLKKNLFNFVILTLSLIIGPFWKKMENKKSKSGNKFFYERRLVYVFNPVFN